MSFYYELEAAPDAWLIAGHRRAHFTAAEKKVTRFPIMLLPLRAGHLLLPMLDIRLAKEDVRTGDGQSVACEVDYESQGVSIEVVPGTTRVTVQAIEGENGALNAGVHVLEVERHDGRVVG